jgi:hypothetical protein
MRLHFPLDRLGLIEWKVFPIGLEVREGDALLYKYREVKRKQISGLQVFIDPNDNKHPRSTNNLYSFARPRNVQLFLPPSWQPHRINEKQIYRKLDNTSITGSLWSFLARSNRDVHRRHLRALAREFKVTRQTIYNVVAA